VSAEAAEAERPPAPTVRLLLLAAPLVALFCAGFLAVQALRSWGAADVAEFADWVPTVAGLVTAVAVGYPNVVLVRGLVALTKRPVSVTVWQLPFAVLMLVVFAALSVALGLRLPRESSYEQMLDHSGEPTVSGGVAVTLAVAVSIIAMVMVFAATILFQSAVQSNAGKRFDKDRHEPDAMGALIAEDERRLT
jgi:hypothetical protein